MARKQSSGRFNRFLDLIGLVDKSEEEQVAQPRRASSARRTGDDYADFEETPRPRRSSADSGVSKARPRVNLESDAFGDEDAWGVSSSYSAGRTASTRASGSRATTGASTSAAAAYAQRRTAAARAADGASRPRSASANEGGSAGQRHHTVIFMIHSVDECKDVILSLIDRKTVLLNLDDLDSAQAQRAVDTMCGASYAIGAIISKASDRTYLITPSNVDVEQYAADTDPYR